jgi:hypothetical protein
MGPLLAQFHRDMVSPHRKNNNKFKFDMVKISNYEAPDYVIISRCSFLPLRSKYSTRYCVLKHIMISLLVQKLLGFKQ